MSLSTKIKELRAERNWTQKELAERAGLTRGYLANLETDMVKNPSADTFLKLSRALNIRPEELYQAAGYVREDRAPYYHRESPEEILERLRVSIASTVPIYNDFPYYPGSSVEPIDYLSIIKQRSRGRSLEGYIVHGNRIGIEVTDGDIIIVDRVGQIDNGDIIAALCKDEVHIARLRKIADELYLENNKGRVKLDDCQVAVPVIEVRKRLK